MHRLIHLFPVVLAAFLLLLGTFAGCSSEDDDDPPPPPMPSLAISLGTSSPAAADVSPSAVNACVFQIALTAGTVEDVSVEAVTFTETGTADAQADIDSVALYVDADDDGAYTPGVDTVCLASTAAGYGAGSTLTFSSLGRVIASGASERWILVYDLAGTATAGETFIPSVAAAADVTAEGDGTADPCDISGPPVAANAQTAGNYGALTLQLGASNPPAANLPAAPFDWTMLQVRLEAGLTEDIDISTVTFTAGGTGDADGDIGSVALYLDADDSGSLSAPDTQIGSSTTFSSGTASFTGLTETITAGPANGENWIVVCSFTSGTLDDTFSVSLAANGDVTAQGATSSQAIAPSGAPVDGLSMTIKNLGTLAVSAGASNPAAAAVPLPPADLPMLQINLEAGATEDVGIAAITFTAGGTGDADTAISSVTLYNDLDGSGTVTGGDVQIGSSAAFSSGTAQFTGLSETITAGAANAENWLVVASFQGGFYGDTFTVGLALNSHVTAVGGTTSLAITPTGAPVNGNAMDVQNTGTLTVSTGAANPVTGNLPTPPNAVPMLQVNLEAGVTEDVTVSSITFNASGSGNPDADISAVELYNDVDGSGTVTAGDAQIGSAGVFSGGTVTFGSLSETITAGSGNSQDWLVVCTFAHGGVGDTYTLSLNGAGQVSATGDLSAAAAAVSGTPVSGGTMTLNAAIPLVITTRRVPRAQDGVAYSYQIQSTGGELPLSWSVTGGTLPTGINLGAATGLLSGTPTAAGQIFTVQAQDAAGAPQTDTELLAIEVDPNGATLVSVISSGGGSHTTIGAAVAAIPNPLNGTYIIEIQDSATYQENVDISYTGGAGSAWIVLRSKYDCLPTIQAQNANDHVVDIQSSGVSLNGLVITGATGSGMCGVFVQPTIWSTAVYNCVIHNNDVAVDNSGNSGTNVDNNTIYGSNGVYIGGGGSAMMSNNIVWATANGGWGIQWYPLGAFSCSENLYHTPNGHVGLDQGTFYTTLAAWQTYSGTDFNSQSGNPNFNNPSSGDFTLTASSLLAIDTGAVGWNILTDAEGYARGHGAGWDRGAYERH